MKWDCDHSRKLLDKKKSPTPRETIEERCCHEYKKEWAISSSLWCSVVIQAWFPAAQSETRRESNWRCGLRAISLWCTTSVTPTFFYSVVQPHYWNMQYTTSTFDLPKAKLHLCHMLRHGCFSSLESVLHTVTFIFKAFKTQKLYSVWCWDNKLNVSKHCVVLSVV